MSARRLLATAFCTCLISPSGTSSARLESETLPVKSTIAQLPIEGELPELGGAIEWINSPPLTVAGLRAKVVLIDFWTYTCINWRRTLPYVRAWAEKYRGHGLVVIGVHTPEFAFEKALPNVHAAMRGLDIHYPVAVDSDYRIWRAFHNEYWPAVYVADAHGHLRHHQFGEGGYAETERTIQQLLLEAGIRDIPQDLVSLEPGGVEAGADWSTLGSPETYVGYARGSNFASPGAATRDRPRTYAVPARLRLNEWALAGDWLIGPEAVALQRGSGHVTYRFHARDVNLIMGPGSPGNAARFRVKIDGEAPGGAHGIDVDPLGNGTVSEPRMYQLIRQPGPIVDRVFDIEFSDSGVEVFDFTFG